MSFPTIFSTAVSNTTPNNTTSAVTLPASIAAGDLIIGFVASDAAAGAMTWPSPWVKILDHAGTGFVLSVGYLIASGGETTVAVTHTNERSNHIAARIKAAEWHGTTPPEVNAAVTGLSGTPNPGSLTPSWGALDTLWVAFFGCDDFSVPFPVTAWPTNYDNNQVSANTSTSAGDVAMASRGLNAASADPGSFTMTVSEDWSAFTLAVRPLQSTSIVPPRFMTRPFPFAPGSAKSQGGNF